MWKNPAQVTDELAVVFWEQTVDTGLIRYNIPVDEMPVSTSLMMFLSDIVTIARRSPNKKVFAALIQEFAYLSVQIIEKHPQILHIFQADLLGIQTKLAPYFGTQLAKHIDVMLSHLLSGLILLLGSETKVLVGVQPDGCVWKEIREIAQDEVIDALMTMVITYGVLPSVGQAEAWMVPDFRRFDRYGKALHEKLKGYRPQCENLLGMAFRDQQYAIHPDGVQVKITGAKDVTGLALKATPQRGGYVDILARVETTRGAFFLVVSQGQLLKGSKVGDVFVIGATRFDYMVCKVYHDLVATDDIPTARVDDTGAVVDATPSRLEAEGWSWTVVPRPGQGQVRSPSE